jgi:hypothetical protein
MGGSEGTIPDDDDRNPLYFMPYTVNVHMDAYLSCDDLTFMSSAVSWKLPSLRDFFRRRTSSSSSLLPMSSSSSFLLIFSLAFSSFEALRRGLKRACMRMRKVVLKVMVSTSPRTSGPPVEDSSMLRNLSRAVWREKAEGLSGTGMTMKDSSGDMAVAFALRIPYLSQLRYLYDTISMELDSSPQRRTVHDVLSS